MGRHVYFGNNFHEHAGGLFLKADELLLGIVSVPGGQSRICVALEPECRVGTVPVPSEVLFESVVVEMYLKGVHFVIGHDAGQLAQVAHRDVLAAAVHHEAAQAVVGPVKDLAAGQTHGNIMGTAGDAAVSYLENGLCPPEHAPGSCGGKTHAVGNADRVTFSTASA